MSITKASEQYFHQVAGQWDALRSGYFSEGVRESAIARAYLRPEMVVADVGAGTGFIAAALANLVQQVHVVDGSGAMLEEARKNLGQFSNVVFHQAAVQSLSLPDASMDVVFANMVLHHCPEPQAAIREMARVLKPGGRLVITDLDAHPYTWLKEEMADEWMGFDRAQMHAWFKQANLVNILVNCTDQSCCAETKDERIAGSDRQAKISVFVATGTKRLAMREVVQQAYSARADSGGSCCTEPSVKLLDLDSALAGSSCCSAAQPCCPGGDHSAEKVTFVTDYSSEDQALVPGEAKEISLGCGNPTAFANLRAGEVVLDIGSGGGIDAFLAASRVGPTGQVIGVDMTPAMLQRARATARKSGILNVEFRQGQAENLPVADSTIDVILSNCVINLCEDKGQVFHEAFRVLKPGGRLEVSDVVTDRPFPTEARTSDWAGCVSGALPEQEYLDLVAQAGFTGIKSRRSTSAGLTDGVAVYSVTVSAVKPVQ